MGLRSGAVFLLAAFASAAAADSLRFDPPVATVHTSVDAILSSLSTGCSPIQEGVIVTGTTVTLPVTTIPPPGVACPAIIFPFTATFHLGVLPAGVYDVVGTLNGSPTAHAKLIVRDDSLTAAPFAVPSTGGEFHVLRRFDTTDNVVVLVDGVAATFVDNDAAGDVYLAPPHAPGTVSISVTSASTSRTAVAALTYFDRAAPPDPALFELVLFPTAFVGPGAFGSLWTTDNYIAPGNEPVQFHDDLHWGSGRGGLLEGVTWLFHDNDPSGLALFAFRGMTSQLMAGSRIRNSTPAGVTSNGTEVHVVRESDFRDRGMYFLSVPVDPRSRVMLRAWALTDASVTIPGMTPFNGITPLKSSLTFVPVPGTPLAFATLDLTTYFHQLPSITMSDLVYFPRAAGLDLRMWGMISVTNNDTQQVTIITSQ
jgi:hypothetical protein